MYDVDMPRVVLPPQANSCSKILLVEDMPSNLRLLSTALTQAGYDVYNAVDGQSAIESVAAAPPDLIILDIGLPDIDGFDVCDQLHRDVVTADIPIIFMSALTDVPDKLRAFSVGGVDYMTKPFQIPELLVRVDHQLEIQRLERQLKAKNQKLHIILRQYEIAEARIHQLNHELEQRVQERTRALHRTNRTLKREIQERQQAQSELFHMAMHDPLTGLANRTFLMDSLEQVMQCQLLSSELSALLLLDCDRFKTINDTLGHPWGDQLLIKIAQRLTATVPFDNLVARLGDDTFALLVPTSTSQDQISALVQQLQQVMADPVELGGHEVTISAFVGIVMVNASYCQAEHILRDGALALIQAKQTCKGWRVFKPEMHEQALHRLTLESLLRQALRQCQLQLFYQPIVTLAPDSATIVGYEALIRWQPEGTSDFLSPADFIPLAEETDLINQLGIWVFQTVCEQLSRWHQVSPQAVPVISVNFSVRHLQCDQFIQQIDEILRRTQIQPAWLKFEITESLLARDTNLVFETLTEVRRRGIQVSIDDFGTGYSSLSYLKQLPVDTLKIDRAFIKDMESSHENYKIVEAIINLAQALDLDVVAEGIENPWQCQQLTQLRCTYGQGYWFSRPLESQAAWSLWVNQR